MALELAGEHRREDEDEDVAQYLPYISPISRLYLAYISPVSRLHHTGVRTKMKMLPSISPISRLYLACISPTSYRREDEDEDVAQDDEHREEDLHEGDIGEM